MPAGRRPLELVERKGLGPPDSICEAVEDAPDLVYPAIPQARTSNTFFVRTSNPWRYTGPQSLETLRRIGLIRDFHYAELNRFIARHPERRQPPS